MRRLRLLTLRQKKNMLSKEEVLDIIAYCKEHGINRRDTTRRAGDFYRKQEA